MANTFWNGRRVLVTGGSGFIGSHLAEMLLAGGARVRVVGRSHDRFRRVLGACAGDMEFLEGDLAEADFAQRACAGQDAVFHLAAKVAGVGYNVSHPGTILYANSIIGAQVLEAAARAGVERVLLTSSACVYRRHCAIPTPESEGFLDDPEPTNLGYGWAKRMLEVQGRTYAQEHGLQVALPRPYNAYGPRDDFDWETSHVIPALIRKVVEGQNPLQVWGDGSQTRSFLYVTDFAAGLMATLEKYPVCEPVNLGADEEITIAELIRLIARVAGREVELQFDLTKPSGQPRRIGDYTRAKTELGWQAQVPLAEGLRETLAWYEAQRAA